MTIDHTGVSLYALLGLLCVWSAALYRTDLFQSQLTELWDDFFDGVRRGAVSGGTPIYRHALRLLDRVLRWQRWVTFPYMICLLCGLACSPGQRLRVVLYRADLEELKNSATTQEVACYQKLYADLQRLVIQRGGVSWLPASIQQLVVDRLLASFVDANNSGN